MDHHPGVLGLHNVRGGIGIGVVEPGAVLVSGGGDGGPGGVGVGSEGLGDVLAHEVRVGGMSDDGLVLIDDEDVPLAVNALPGVVVGDGGIESFRFVSADGVPYQELGVVGGRRLGRYGRHGITRVQLLLHLLDERRDGGLIHEGGCARGTLRPGRPLLPGRPSISLAGSN